MSKEGKSKNLRGKVLYSDRAITVTDEMVEIPHYYFPIATSKRIKLSDITTATVERPGMWEHKGWGMGFSNVWWPFHTGGHETHLVISTGSWIRSGCSPDDPGKVAQLLYDLRHQGKEEISTPLEPSK
eukprot:NODE_595_length_720_cov_88.888702_g586_i0.p1 GENE.NODE_595_length_720_cov_88.888702_g586_i0~~NODE_595_length_720_cov_88.888702_g586_i0.p1  ORF type:complete len:128 (-),score=17.95 NODE_595_length_720_cov_88.888702_g586_i0:173-556(-)